MKFVLNLSVIIAFLIILGRVASADALIVDISERLIQIDLGFTGKKVMLYGAIEGEGNIVVIVKGPRKIITVRRKARIAGVWANDASVTFQNAISFYNVMASAELNEWLPYKLRKKFQIGVEYLKFSPTKSAKPGELADFETALIRNKQKLGHYDELEGQVNILGGKLFRTEIFFPANVPTGNYTLQAFLIRDGEIVSKQNTPLYVSKSGIEAEVYNLAHKFPAAYGIIAILIAVVAGLAANAGALRR